jgi:hypothetical protein
MFTDELGDIDFILGKLPFPADLPFPLHIETFFRVFTIRRIQLWRKQQSKCDNFCFRFRKVILLDLYISYFNSSSSSDEVRIAKISNSNISNATDLPVSISKKENGFLCALKSQKKIHKKKRTFRDLANTIYNNSSHCQSAMTMIRIPLPRIPKRDVRRNYGVMFANVYNAVNYDYMMKYLNHFVTDDAILAFIQPGGSHNSVQGSRSSLGECWFTSMNEFPDLQFDFNANRIKLRSDDITSFIRNISNWWN